MLLKIHDKVGFASYVMNNVNSLSGSSFNLSSTLMKFPLQFDDWKFKN